jgi:predicted dienelactone hydrolase
MLLRVMHYTFLDSCTPAGRKQLPGFFCYDQPGVNRARVHARVAAMALRFFNASLSR